MSNFKIQGARSPLPPPLPTPIPENTLCAKFPFSVNNVNTRQWRIKRTKQHHFGIGMDSPYFSTRIIYLRKSAKAFHSWLKPGNLMPTSAILASIRSLCSRDMISFQSPMIPLRTNGMSFGRCSEHCNTKRFYLNKSWWRQLRRRNIYSVRS